MNWIDFKKNPPIKSKIGDKTIAITDNEGIVVTACFPMIDDLLCAKIWSNSGTVKYEYRSLQINKILGIHALS
ncbi:hypothetical protein LCGC14_2631710 [marine sediment metagenome]|uniref:Uncharacterized protein n=1 Tax=marine sediment metagenome TaxID=412755 RepID=A0A0F9CB24_9ZZZZ